jgi:hypothetical protein
MSWNDPSAIGPALGAGGALPGHDIDRAVGLDNRKPFPLSGADLQRVSVAETLQDGMLDTGSGSHRKQFDPRPNHEAAYNRGSTQRRGWGDCGSLLGYHRRGCGRNAPLDVSRTKRSHRKSGSDGRKANLVHVAHGMRGQA